MKLLYTLSCFLLMTMSLQAQTRISGTVTDTKGKALPGVNITIKDSYDGATSDEKGHFAFTTSEKGQQVLVISLTTYSTQERNIDLSGSPVTINAALSVAVNQLNMVTISAGSFEAGAAGKNNILKPLDIATTAGAGADIVGALKTLPGTQQIGESSGLFVRGGTGTETQTFIDGLLVRNPYFSSVPDIGQRGRFSPFLFKGTVFSSGGYSAQYGHGLSGAIILESEDLPERSSASLSVSSIGLGGAYDKLSKNKKSSYGGDINYINLAPYFLLQKQKQDFTTGPAYLNGDFNFRHKTSSTGMLKFYGYANVNNLGFYQKSVNHPGGKDLFELKNLDVYTNLTYHEQLTDKLKLYLGTSYSTNTDKIHIGTKDSTVLYDEAHIRKLSDLTQGKVELSRSLGSYSTIRAGTEYEYAVDRYRYKADGSADAYPFIDDYTAAYAESDIFFSSRIVGRFGLRAEHSTLLDHSDIAPRISLGYKIKGATQLSMAYGDFYEKPDTLFWLIHNDLNFIKARHYIVNIQHISDDYTFRVEAYYKKYYGLVKTSPDTSNTGSGYAKGIEVFWRDRKTFKNVDYWISYSYIDTKRDFLNYPYAVQPDFAANHTLSVVYKQYFPKLGTNLGLTYTFASGRPYYDPNLPENKFMSERTIPYNSLNLSIAYLRTIGKAFTVFVLSYQNVLGNKIVYGYNYSDDGAYKQAITPPANHFIYLGMFMSFGIDRSQDVINNNL